MQTIWYGCYTLYWGAAWTRWSNQFCCQIRVYLVGTTDVALCCSSISCCSCWHIWRYGQIVYWLCLVIFLILTLILILLLLLITTIIIILTNLSTAAQVKDGSPGNPEHTVHWSTLASQQTLFIIIIIIIKPGYLFLHLQALWCQLKIRLFHYHQLKIKLLPFCRFRWVDNYKQNWSEMVATEN